MGKKSNNYKTRHHELPKSKNGSNDPDNIIMLEDKIHKAFHCVFSNKTPIQQMRALTYHFNLTCLTDEFKEDIRDILSVEDDEYYYKKGVLRRRR